MATHTQRRRNWNNTSSLLVILAVIIAGGIFIFISRAATPSAALQAELGTKSGNAAIVTDATASGNAFVRFSNVCVRGGICTKADVAQHNIPSNCWVYYGTNVYDVTAYVSKHPGGSAHFPASTVCGNDVGPYLGGARLSGIGSHNHSSTAYNAMATYLYATLGQ